MIRFRFTEDERRYLSLLSKTYRLMAKHMPPQAVSEAMRAIGKTQEILQLEGVRQGLAAAALAMELHESGAQMLGMPPDGLLHAKAFQLHALVYGSADTPLRAAEQESLESMRLPGDHRSGGWLDGSPMRFAPDTEDQWATEAARLPQSEPVQDQAPEALHAPEAREDSFLDGLELPPPDDLDMQERPDLLDRIRDTLQAKTSKGWKPTSWQELIVHLHMELHIDAGFLDLQLNTPMGRTVLEQSGLLIDPGISVDLTKIYDSIREEQASATPAVLPEPEGDGSAAEKNDGPSPPWE